MVFSLTKELVFPPVHLSDDDGLLAVGGDLSTERLLLAYRSGIFPWYNEPPILWWSPDPRFVLFPSELKVSASMRQILKKQVFRITFNQNFAAVIRGCRHASRKGQDGTGTWITNAIERAYIQLHEQGYAHSVECWLEDKLVGGLYGIRLGNCFFGESMFANVSNASKAAFITFVQSHNDLTLVDCQVHTEHLATLGARFINRDEFLGLIE